MQINTINPSLISRSSIKVNKQDNPKSKHNGNSVLDTLEKQKDDLINRKSKLMDNALQSNSDSSMKDKIDEINKQIEEIEKKIADVQRENSKKDLNKQEEKKKNTKQTDEKSDGQADNNISTKQMNSMLNVHADMKAAKMAFSQEKSGKNRKAVLSTEIKLDGERSSGNPNPKMEEINAIDDEMKSLDKTIAGKIYAINNEGKEDNKNKDKNKNTQQDKNDEKVGRMINFVA